MFPKLFKYTSKGQVQCWQIIVEGNQYRTVEGLIDGVLTESKPTTCKPKNVGRANETSGSEQARAEAQSKWQKKVDQNYNKVLTRERKFFEPMLAHELKKYEKLLFTVPTFVQPKLDGIRCVSQNNTLMSRTGKPILSCPHLYQNLGLLDGELYNHDLKHDFNKIVSLVKKQDPSAAELEETAAKVEFWAYDLPGPSNFSLRSAQLAHVMRSLAMPVGYKRVPTLCVTTLQGLEEAHEAYLEQGFEGSIIRLDIGGYENKRSRQLLKKKDFQDEEFKILGFQEGEGNRAGTIGAFVMDLADGTGRTFKSNVKGDLEYVRDLWTNRNAYLGKSATVKYFNRTPDNIPRFPYIIGISRSDYE